MNPKVKLWNISVDCCIAKHWVELGCTITKHFEKSSAEIVCRSSGQMLASALQVNDANS